MNKEKLYNEIRETFGLIAKEFEFSKADFGSGFKKKAENDIYTLSHAQIVTQGVMDNKFEFSPSAKCTIMQVEGLWHDLYPLTILMPNENSMSKDSIEKFKKLYPTTYGVQYDNEKVRAKFPENITDTGWLCFEISDIGFEQFKKVLRFIISELLIPELEKYHSIELLDKMLNSKIEITENETHIINSHQGFFFRRMVIARLNKNPLYEDICKYMRDTMPQLLDLSKRPGMEYFKNYPYVFEEVYSRLERFDELP